MRISSKGSYLFEELTELWALIRGKDVFSTELCSNYSFNARKLIKLDGLWDSVPTDVDQVTTTVDTLKTSIKGRVTEPALFALWLHVLNSKKCTNMQHFPCPGCRLTKMKKCFPLLLLNHIFLSQFFSFMEFERCPGNCVNSLQRSHCS